MRRTLPNLLSLILLLALLQPGGFAGQAQSETAPIQDKALPALGCGESPAAAALLGEVSLERWSDWVRKLSGETPALVGGKLVRIATRHSPALFNGGSAGYAFVREQVAAWYPEAQIEDHSYTAWYNGEQQTWKNLVLTIPGAERASETVLLTAHLDSRSGDPETSAPGADDNATGSAALLEAARVMRGKSLPRTLRLVWFTGEEQYMLGSFAYTASRDLSDVVGVFNVDMIGYDADGDRCFELHVGSLPASQPAGRCVVLANSLHDLGLTYDWKGTSFGASDHAPFWGAGVGAVLLVENFMAEYPVSGCPGPANPDRNPNYHQATDTFANLSLPFAFDVARASVAAAFMLADPQPVYYILFPMVKNE